MVKGIAFVPSAEYSIGGLFAWRTVVSARPEFSPTVALQVCGNSAFKLLQERERPLGLKPRGGRTKRLEGAAKTEVDSNGARIFFSKFASGRLEPASVFGQSHRNSRGTGGTTGSRECAELA